MKLSLLEKYLSCLAAIGLMTGASAADTPEGSVRTEIAEINLEAREGLVFYPARAKAKAGSLLTVHFYNADPNDMPHNVCLVAPGKLAEIQQASLAIDSGAEARGFVPDSPAILAHSELVGAEERTSFSFQLPEEARDIYYLVCTFPGHSMVMYSPLYVGTGPKLTLAEDPEVSPVVRQKEMNRMAALQAAERPSMRRVIMDDTGPASILVALPGGLNYCWDASSCRLRYAWKGAFANPFPHYDGNGAKRPVILGDEFWRSLPGETVSGVRPSGSDPVQTDYLGYDLEDGIPTFRYRVNGTEVQERITAPGGVLNWRVELVEAPANAGSWSVLAPVGETAVIEAADSKREGDALVFSAAGQSPIEITISPELP